MGHYAAQLRALTCMQDAANVDQHGIFGLDARAMPVAVDLDQCRDLNAKFLAARSDYARRLDIIENYRDIRASAP